MTGDFGGAKIAVLTGERLIALRRDDDPSIPWPGYWDLPGGGREGGETPRETALRELREETGLHLDPARIHHAREYGPPAVWFFAARLDGLTENDLRLGDEGQALELMRVERFLQRDDAIPLFQQRLRDALLG